VVFRRSTNFLPRGRDELPCQGVQAVWKNAAGPTAVVHNEPNFAQVHAHTTLFLKNIK
jgi:hypothetical protein